jgi:hypothetical protein
MGRFLEVPMPPVAFNLQNPGFIINDPVVLLVGLLGYFGFF